MIRESAQNISRDTTVVAVLGTVTLEIAAALGDVARRGWLVTAIVVSMEMDAVPDWARPPDWAEMLLAQGIDFRVVNSEEGGREPLCAECDHTIKMIPNKPQKTAADLMVIALSPALIMLLVGSLCFFLIEVFYHGKMEGTVRWVMFWFVVAIVLVTRIAIEQNSEYAALYGLALAGTVWFYLVRTQPAYLLGLLLLAIVWFCAHKLVWDCTLIIDEDEDSSGQGLLPKPSD